MDGVGRTVGAGLVIDLEGKTWVLDPITIRDYGLIENKISSKRANPLDLVKDSLGSMPEAVAKELALKAYEDAKSRNAVTPKQMQQYLKTMNGMIFIVWLKMHQKYGSEWTVERVERAFEAMGEEKLAEVQKAQEIAAGTDMLGNSTGPGSPPENQASET